MKKIAMIFIFLLPFTACFAQKTETSATFGLASIQQGINLVADQDRSEYLRMVGTYFITFRYKPGKHISIGATLGFQSGEDGYIDHIQNVTMISCKEVQTTFAFEFKWTYFQIKDYGELYSYVGVGTTYTSMRNVVIDARYPGNFGMLYPKGYSLNYQLPTVGLRLGRKLSWIIELGLGYKGLINTGISYRFGQVLRVY